MNTLLLTLLSLLPFQKINQITQRAPQRHEASWYDAAQERKTNDRIHSAYRAIEMKNNFKLPDVGNVSNVTDTLIVGLAGNDTTVITGNWTHTGPIWVFNHGVLIFDNATVIDSGDIYVWGHGRIIADSSSLTFPQAYFYQRSLLFVDTASGVFTDCSFNYSGYSHNLFLSGSADVSMTRIHQNDWTTCGVWGHSNLAMNHVNLTGEYILTDSSTSSFSNADTLILWHQFPQTAVVNFQFPQGDTVYNYVFNNTISGVSGINYNVSADSCHDVMWAMMPVNGSDIRISDSEIRAIGAWFQRGDTTSINGIFNNSIYTTTYTAPITDRILQLTNTSVLTWSMYVMDSSQITITNCQLGEVGSQSHANVNSQGFLLDGSGGYFWATDTSTVFAETVTVYSTVRSERNGLFFFYNGYQPFITGSAIGNSVLVCIEDSFPTEPVAFDGSVVWYQKINAPDTLYLDSLYNITGSAWIDQGPLGHPVDFSNYSFYVREINAISPTPLVIDSASEIHLQTLGSWYTGGLTPGLYEFSLKVVDNFGDSITSLKQVYLSGTPTGLNEIENSNFTIFPNPANESFSFKGMGEGIVTVKNFFGEEVYSSKVNGEELCPISCSGWAAGVYLIEYTLGDGTKLVNRIVIK